MNETIKTQALAALQQVITDTTTLRDFAVAQAPEVIRELLTWKFTVSLICFATGAILLTLGNWGTKKLGDYEYRQTRDRGFSVILHLVVTGLGLGLLSSNLDWLQILIAPRVWLIEYAANLL